MDHTTGKVEITSMNHGFAVDRDSLPAGVAETHVSLFDGSNCGIRLQDRPVFSVQYHPEGSPGPQDSHYLFVRFMNMIRAARVSRKCPEVWDHRMARKPAAGLSRRPMPRPDCSPRSSLSCVCAAPRGAEPVAVWQTRFTQIARTRGRIWDVRAGRRDTPAAMMARLNGRGSF